MEALMPVKIRIGLLGAGHGHAGGKLHVLQALPEFKVVGVAERNPEVREQDEGAPSLGWRGDFFLAAPHRPQILSRMHPLARQPTRSPARPHTLAHAPPRYCRSQ